MVGSDLASERTHPRPAREVVGDSGLPRLGILGGGQLAKMVAQAAAQLGCRTLCVERERDCPAALVTRVETVSSWEASAEVAALLESSEVVTLENEFIPESTLLCLESRGRRVLPGPRTMERIRDKFVQKTTLAAAGLPVPAFAAVESPEEIVARGRAWGWPLVLKARCHGYDGKGNATLQGPPDVLPAWERLGGDRGRALYVEAFCAFERELAVIVTRGRDGQCAVYPVVQTIQSDHICHQVVAPAGVPPVVAARAADLARAAVESVGGIGSFGVELFLGPDGTVWINELAPRVHNSGHYTIEACECSQFENHVRAVLGWPLGSPRMRVPAAVMVNLLGRRPGSGRVRGLEQALAIPGVHVHVYGKARSAPGRKMGHVTALGAAAEEALAKALAAAEALDFGDADA